MTETTVDTQCKGLTRDNARCRLKAGPTGYCGVHQPAVAEVSAEAAAPQAAELEILHELGELGEEYTIQVCRMPGNVYLDRIQSSDLSLDHIKGLFGGGRFVLRPQRNGRFFPGGKTVEVRIEGPPKTPGEPAPSSSEPAAAAPVTGGFAETMAAMGAIMQAQAMTMAPLIQAVAERPAGPDPMEMALRMLEVIQSNRPEPSPYGDVLENVAKPLLGIIGAPRTAPQTNGAAPAPAPAEPAPAAEAERSPEGYAHAISAWLEPHRKKDGNPGLWAEVFLEETGAEVDGDAELLAWGAQAALHPQALDLWAAAVPVVGENREWYGTFLSELRTLLEEAEPAPDDSTGGPGDVVDGVAHAEPQPAGVTQ